MKYKYPKLQNWQDFELLCRDIMSAELSINFIQFGRYGQKQNGIDFYAKLSSTVIAIQCKNTNKLTLKQIQKELEEIKYLDINISSLYFMTSSNRDVELQKQIINYNIELNILFWEDIEERLNKHKDIVLKYYPNYNTNIQTDFFNGKENFYQLYQDKNKDLLLICNEYNIIIEIKRQDISLRFNNDTYRVLNNYDDYITLIELPFNELFIQIQNLYYNEGEVLSFDLLVSPDWGIEINVGLEGVLYCGSYYIENNLLYSDDEKMIDPITTKEIFRVIQILENMKDIVYDKLNNLTNQRS